MLGRTATTAASCLAAMLAIGGCAEEENKEPDPTTVLVVSFVGLDKAYPRADNLELCVADKCSDHSDPAHLVQLKADLPDPEQVSTLQVTLTDAAGRVLAADDVEVPDASNESEGERHVTFRASESGLADGAEMKRIEERARINAPSRVAFWDEARGIVGTGEWNSAGGVLTTSDGGRTFQRTLETDSQVVWTDVAADGAELDAWVETVDKRGEKRTLFHSDDAGLSWEELPDQEVEMPSFATPSVGIAEEDPPGKPPHEPDPNAIYYTDDGGESWQERTRPCARYADEFLSMPAPTTAWATCTSDLGGGSETATIYFSDDAGSSWEKRYDGAVTTGTEGAVFASDGFGLFFNSPWSSVTRDGGSTLQDLRGPNSPYTWASPLPGGKAFGLADTRLVHTDDGGETWTVRNKRPGPS